MLEQDELDDVDTADAQNMVRGDLEDAVAPRLGRWSPNVTIFEFIAKHGATLLDLKLLDEVVVDA